MSRKKKDAKVEKEEQAPDPRREAKVRRRELMAELEELKAGKSLERYRKDVAAARVALDQAEKKDPVRAARAALQSAESELARAERELAAAIQEVETELAKITPR